MTTALLAGCSPNHDVGPAESGGVDDAGTVACRVDDHGFVITPTETTVF